VAFRLGADGSVRRTRVRLYEEDFENPADQALTTEVESPGWDIAGYGLADYRIGPATISAGVRWDRVVVPFRDRLDPAADTTSTFARVSPRGGISVDIGAGSSVYASAGQAFRAPVVLELACADPEAACPLPFALGDDPPLDPVVATTLEAGALATTGPLLLALSAYRTAVRDEILFVGSDVSRLAGYFANFSRTRREGIELSARGSPGSTLSTYASYAWTRATYRGTAELFSIRSEDEFDGHDLAGDNVVTPGDRIPLTPSHQVKLGGRLQIVPALAVGVEARYTGSQWLRGDEANETTPLDGWFAANARVEVRVGSWEMTGIVTNLFGSGKPTFGTFNENRRSGALERFLTPMQPRSVSVTLTRRFGG
jgi:outer membrane receptor protein involved in Fe transport